MTLNQTFSQYLLSERLRTLAGSRTISLVSEVGVIWASVLLLTRSHAWQPVILWAMAAQAASFYSWYSHSGAYDENSEEKGRRLLRNIVFGTWLVASVWGSVPLFFYQSGNTTMLIILVCLYAGYVSGALAVTLAYSRSFIAFVIGITTPFAGRLLYEGDQLSLIIVGLIFFYIVMLSVVSRKLQSLYESGVQSNYKNLQLIEQLVVEKDNAERATHAKSQFLASASHDLRQPIHAANLFLDILQPLQTEPQSQSILQKVRQSMQGLNKMLHSLLDISRLDASAVENEPQNLALNEVVEKLITEHEASFNGVQIINQLPPKTFVHGDAMIIERIVRNLLDNAIKYTHKGDIRFTAFIEDDTVCLTLTDSGIGIPEDKLPFIYDEFTQVNNPERDRQKGLGLGLAIVKRLCLLAGFDLEITSQLGNGTKAKLCMPLGQAPRPDDSQLSEQALLGLRILVVDDEEDILAGMTTLLKQWGCHVVGASTYEQARELAEPKKRFVPTVLITDFRLRGEKSGIDLIQEFKARFGQGLITILITGDTAPERVQQASESGATVIYKPVDGATLKHTIQNLISRNPV